MNPGSEYISDVSRLHLEAETLLGAVDTLARMRRGMPAADRRSCTRLLRANVDAHTEATLEYLRAEDARREDLEAWP